MYFCYFLKCHFLTSITCRKKMSAPTWHQVILWWSCNRKKEKLRGCCNNTRSHGRSPNHWIWWRLKLWRFKSPIWPENTGQQLWKTEEKGSKYTVLLRMTLKRFNVLYCVFILWCFNVIFFVLFRSWSIT